MYTKFISQNIQEKLKAKERALSWKTRNASQEIQSGALLPKDMMARSVFFRMCSNKIDSVPNVLISNGEMGEDGLITFGSSIYRGSQFRPISGIKDVSVTYKGSFKAIREATVNWTIPMIEDLNRLTPYFLTIGKTVVLDWGWTYSKGSTSLTDQLGSRPFIYQENGEFKVDQKIFTSPQTGIIEKSGDYDAMGGVVSKFNYTLREDGGFDCVTTIIAMGAMMLKKPIDSGGNRTSTTKGNSPDASPIYTPPDSLINAVINLRSIIIYDIFKQSPGIGDNRIAFEQNEILHNDKHSLTKSMHGLDLMAPEKKPESFLDKAAAAVTKVAKLSEKTGDQYGIASPNYREQINSGAPTDIILTVRPGKEDIFVSWAWFEDQFLNRYVTLTGGSGDGRSTSMSIRSVDTVTDQNGKPITWQEYKNLMKSEDSELSKETQEYLKKLYDADIWASGGSVTWDTNELTDVVKSPSLIRNPDLLFPVDPFKFFMLDTVIEPELIANLGAVSGWDDYVFFWNDDTDQSKARISKFINLLFGNEKPSTLRSPLRKFESRRNKNFGQLRNIFVNIKEIQKAFGVNFPDSSNKSDDNVNPTGTIEKAMDILLHSLNTNFHNIWDFELVTDPYDSTNLKVIDKSDTEIGDPIYSKFETNSHKVQTLGIYPFPSFKIGSMVKSQTLDFKISDAQALTAMYGSNKKQGTDNIEFNDSQLSKLFRVNSGSLYEDKYLQNLEPSYVNSEKRFEIDKYVPITVGSKQSNHNAKIKIGTEGSPVDPRKVWWKSWTPGIKSDDQVGASSATNDGKKKPLEKFQIINNEILWVKENKAGSGLFSATTDTTGNKKKPPIYKYDKSPDAPPFTLIQDAAYSLNTFYNSSSPLHQFNTNSLIPAELGLEIDGIGGIVPGDVIHTEYIENKYKTELTTKKEGAPEGQTTPRGPVTYFQIFTVTQKISAEAWITEIGTKMRLNSFPQKEIIVTELPVNTPTKALEKTSGNYTILTEEEKKPLPRPSIPVPTDDEDIPDDVTLDDLDFDDFEPWDPPPVPTQLDIELPKETSPVTLEKIKRAMDAVPQKAPVDVPVTTPESNLEDDPNPLTIAKEPSGNDIDTNYVVPEEPGISRFPGLVDKFPLGKSQQKFKLDIPATSQISALPQKVLVKEIIHADPAPSSPKNVVRHVSKPQFFESQVDRNLNFEYPEQVVEVVRKKIKEVKSKPIPPKIIKKTVDKVSTYQNKAANPDYRVRVKQNEMLYSIREDWRPLYIRTAGSSRGNLTGQRTTKYNGVKYNNVQIREKRDLESIRKPFWDKYIEEKNGTGITKATENTRTSTPIPEGIERAQRSVYWYSEDWTPGYQEKKAGLLPADNYISTE
jgi:hypothetical protein